MKKIVVFGFTNLIGGLENFYMSFYRRLIKEDFQIDFICSFDKIAFADELKQNGSTIYYVPSIKKHLFSYIKEVTEILKTNNYDVVHANMLSAANIVNLWLAKKAKVKTIIAHSHCAGVSGSKIKYIMHKINKNKIPKLANVYLSCSDLASKWLFPENVTPTIITNAMDLDVFLFNQEYRKEIRKQYNISTEDYLIGHVGRLSAAKNQKFIIELAKKISDQHIKFMFVGNGEDRPMILKLIEQYNLNDKIIIVPETKEIYKYYSAFDLFIFPSIFEGLGIAAVEAQISGLRCLFSENIVPDVNILDNNNYLNLNCENPWLQIIERKKIYNREIDKSVFDQKGFNIEKECKKLEKIYNGDYNEKSINNSPDI